LSSFIISRFLLWSYSVYFVVCIEHFISAAVIIALSCSCSVQVSLPYSAVGIARVLYICNLVCFCTLDGFGTY
jgi:Zn-dependent protease